MFALTHLAGFGAFTHSTAPPPASYIVSIQPFEITIGTSATSNTATISSVNASRSVIFFGGFTTTHNSGTTTYREFMPRVELTNGTTVTAYRDTSSATYTITVRGTVVEFDASAIGSVQAGTVTVAASTTSGTATISSVDTSRSAVFFLGQTNTTTTTSGTIVFSRIDLTNSTTVTATRNTSSTAVLTVGYAVVEFDAAVIASVQQRAISPSGTSLTATDTISSVNTGRTLLLYNGATASTATQSTFQYNLELTGSTTVTLTRAGSGSSGRTVHYTAVEFASGVINSIQRGTTAIASATSADAAISSVNTSKALCNWTNFNTNASDMDERFATVKLLDSTHVRDEKNTAGTSTSTVGWEVVEWV